MAILHKRANREDWLRWAITFMRRGLWLADEIEVHGPQDCSASVWGNASATFDSTTENVPCVFFAKVHRSNYYPVRIHIFPDEPGDEVNLSDRFLLVSFSQLTPKARRWLWAAQRTATKLRRKRIAAKHRARQLCFEFKPTAARDRA